MIFYTVISSGPEKIREYFGNIFLNKFKRDSKYKFKKMENINSKYVDLTYLKLLSNGSNEFICEMIDVFMAQIPEGLDEMDKHWNVKDWKSLHRAAHRMKPSFSFMGIKELENDIILIDEYSATETNINLLPPLISKLKRVCSIALQELKIEKQLFI